MTRMPRVTGKQVVRALQRAGFTVAHIEGSHHYLRRVEKKGLVTVPVHSGKTLKLKTLKTILEQAELEIDEFLRLL